MKNNYHFCHDNINVAHASFDVSHVSCTLNQHTNGKLILESSQCLSPNGCFDDEHEIEFEMEVKFCPMCGFTPEVKNGK